MDLAEGPDLDDNSFPSGHATISTALALALALVMVTPRRWWALAVLAVALGGLGISVVTGGDNPFTWRGLDFLVGSVVVTVVGVDVVAWFVRLLRGSVLGVRPDPAGSGTGTRQRA